MKHPDSPWAFLTGLLDGDPKLREDIKQNPKAIYSLIKPLQAKFGGTLNVPSIKEAAAYVAGYLDLPWESVEELL
jgi:hypothetical protein